MKQILLVEDSSEIHKMVNLALSSIGSIDWAQNLAEARNQTAEKHFDIILLDVELPDGSGLSLCSELQAKAPTTPIFFLTSHKDLSQKVLGFSAGADDYITKPFEPLELKARVESRFQKMEILLKTSDILRWKELEINKSRQEVRVFENEKPIPVDLTALEFKLLSFFAIHEQNVISRDHILNEIWGEDVHVYARSVDTHVSKLRKKLGPVAEIIESIHGAGYKFSPSPL